MLLAGCAATTTPDGISSPAVWRELATDADRERLGNWRETWLAARASAEAGGHGAELAREGVLLRPDSALADVTPPIGLYACRTIKVGSPASDGLAYVAYPAFQCRISAGEGGQLRFTKLTGSQRQVGTLYPDVPGRMAFLGTMALGDETGAMPYRADAERDMIGALERVGQARWRLFFPQPRWESLLDVIELVPIAE
jgi:hypothetical protein